MAGTPTAKQRSEPLDRFAFELSTTFKFYHAPSPAVADLILVRPEREFDDTKKLDQR